MCEMCHVFSFLPTEPRFYASQREPPQTRIFGADWEREWGRSPTEGDWVRFGVTKQSLRPFLFDHETQVLDPSLGRVELFKIVRTCQLLPFGVTWLDNPTLLIGHQTGHPDRKR